MSFRELITKMLSRRRAVSWHRDLRGFLENVLPSWVVDSLRWIIRRPAQPVRFLGDYKSWKEAEKNSTGYAAPEILAKTRAALLKVKSGEAAFERDSVVFATMQHEFPLLAALFRAAAETGGSLSVLDFGGALGSSYFQSRKFLSTLSQLRWSVVEQPAQVACGRADFENEELCFYDNISTCLETEAPDLALISGVLQYLPEPYVTLQQLLSHGIRHVFVDRTTVFMDDTPDRLTLQTVPDWIYRASYPCWMLNYNRMLELCTRGYQLISEFPAHSGISIPFENGRVAVYRGMLLQLKRQESLR